MGFSCYVSVPFQMLFCFQYSSGGYSLYPVKFYRACFKTVVLNILAHGLDKWHGASPWWSGRLCLRPTLCCPDLSHVLNPHFMACWAPPRQPCLEIWQQGSCSQLQLLFCHQMLGPVKSSAGQITSTGWIWSIGWRLSTPVLERKKKLLHTCRSTRGAAFKKKCSILHDPVTRISESGGKQPKKEVLQYVTMHFIIRCAVSKPCFQSAPCSNK